MMKAMTVGKPWKIILAFSFPIMAGNLLQQLYSTADTLIVGKVEGETALSAVGACANLTELFTALAIGFSIGAGVLVAQYYGAGRKKVLREYAATSILLIAVLGVFMSVLGVLTGEFLLKNMLHVPEDMRGLSVLYFRIYSTGLLFQFGYNIFAAILRSVGDSASTLYFLLISSAVNILLDLLLVKGFGLGVAGAAAATVISQFGACLISGIYMYRKYELLRFKFCEMRFMPGRAQDIMRVGAPMALQQAVTYMGILLLQRLVNSYGQAMIAAFTVAGRLQGFMTIPVRGLQSTMATFAGQNAGGMKQERITRGLWQSVGMSVGITFVVAAVIYGGMDGIVRSFGIDTEAAEICVRYLHVSVPSILMYAAYFPMNGMFQGVGDGVHATAYAMLALALRLLFSYTLSSFEYWGYRAIWWSETFAWIIVISVYYIYYFRGSWKNKALIS